MTINSTEDSPRSQKFRLNSLFENDSKHCYATKPKSGRKAAIIGVQTMMESTVEDNIDDTTRTKLDMMQQSTHIADDIERLKGTFEKLQFQTTVKSGYLTSVEVETFIEQFAAGEQGDMVCICIITQGEDYGKIGVLQFADGNTRTLSTLVKPILAAPSLQGKPKIFITQAYQDGSWNDKIQKKFIVDDIDVVELKEEQAHGRTLSQSVKETFTRVFQHCRGPCGKMLGDCCEEDNPHYTDSEFAVEVAKLNEMADRIEMNAFAECSSATDVQPELESIASVAVEKPLPKQPTEEATEEAASAEEIRVEIPDDEPTNAPEECDDGSLATSKKSSTELGFMDTFIVEVTEGKPDGTRPFINDNEMSTQEISDKDVMELWSCPLASQKSFFVANLCEILEDLSHNSLLDMVIILDEKMKKEKHEGRWAIHSMDRRCHFVPVEDRLYFHKFEAREELYQEHGLTYLNANGDWKAPPYNNRFWPKNVLLWLLIALGGVAVVLAAMMAAGPTESECAKFGFGVSPCTCPTTTTSTLPSTTTVRTTTTTIRPQFQYTRPITTTGPTEDRCQWLLMNGPAFKDQYDFYGCNATTSTTTTTTTATTTTITTTTTTAITTTLATIPVSNHLLILFGNPITNQFLDIDSDTLSTELGFSLDGEVESTFGCSTTYKGAHYIFGGSTHGKQISRVENGQVTRIGTLPKPFNLPSCGVYDKNNQPYVLICFNYYFQECVSWSDDGSDATVHPSSSAYSHRVASIGRVGQSLFVIGSDGDETKRHRGMEEFINNEWVVRGDFPYANEYYNDYSMVSFENALYVFGGKSEAGELTLAARYGKNAHGVATWTKLGDLLGPRRGHRSIVLNTNIIIHVGGYGARPFEKWTMDGGSITRLELTSTLTEHARYPEVFALSPPAEGRAALVTESSAKSPMMFLEFILILLLTFVL